MTTYTQIYRKECGRNKLTPIFTKYQIKSNNKVINNFTKQKLHKSKKTIQIKITYHFFRLIATVQAQTLQIQNLSDTQGLLQIKLGKAKTTTDYTNATLNYYKNNVMKIEESLKYFTLSSYSKGSLQMTKFKLTDLKSKLSLITPRYSNKRGLFNGIGLSVKFITGNMNNNDAFRINEAIFNLTIKVQTETNKQMYQIPKFLKDQKTLQTI